MPLIWQTNSSDVTSCVFRDFTTWQTKQGKSIAHNVTQTTPSVLLQLPCGTQRRHAASYWGLRPPGDGGGGVGGEETAFLSVGVCVCGGGVAQACWFIQSNDKPFDWCIYTQEGWRRRKSERGSLCKAVKSEDAFERKCKFIPLSPSALPPLVRVLDSQIYQGDAK